MENKLASSHLTSSHLHLPSTQTAAQESSPGTNPLGESRPSGMDEEEEEVKKEEEGEEIRITCLAHLEGCLELLDRVCFQSSWAMLITLNS